MEQKKKKSGLRALLILIIAAAALFTCYRIWSPEGDTSRKNISVDVIYADQTSDTFSIETEEETLRGALEQEHLVEGTESQYGLFVKTVNGVTADDSRQEWWCFTKNGESLETGVDTTMIADGDQYEITLTTGY